MKKIQIHVANCELMKYHVEQFVKIPDINVAIISIGCPGRETPIFDSKIFSILYLDFDDIDTRTPCDDTKYKLFDENMAKQILNFVDICIKNSKNKLLMCIHCDAGISRSPAVALALSEIYNKAETMPTAWNLFNRHVYSTIKFAHRGKGPKFT